MLAASATGSLVPTCKWDVFAEQVAALVADGSWEISRAQIRRPDRVGMVQHEASPHIEPIRCHPHRDGQQERQEGQEESDQCAGGAFRPQVSGPATSAHRGTPSRTPLAGPLRSGRIRAGWGSRRAVVGGASPSRRSTRLPLIAQSPRDRVPQSLPRRDGSMGRRQRRSPKQRSGPNDYCRSSRTLWRGMSQPTMTRTPCML